MGGRQKRNRGALSCSWFLVLGSWFEGWGAGRGAEGKTCDDGYTVKRQLGVTSESIDRFGRG